MIIGFFITFFAMIIGLLIIVKGVHVYEKLKEKNIAKAEIMYFLYAILGSAIMSLGAISWTKIIEVIK